MLRAGRSGGGFARRGVRGLPLLPALSLDFINAPSSALSRLTFTRASAGTYIDSAGLLQAALTDVARIDYLAGVPLGLLIEEARTNVVLWNRDLTNAAWTASNVTVAKTATGIDGVANSASTLTATAGNGTVLQAITLASSARFQSAWVKRRTGTGTINMTMDNGSTWTAITVTSSWSRLTIPTQTLANPTVGFRIVTSGDAIDVDYVQNENGTFATSSIATTTASVTRAADVCSILTSAFPFNAAAYTMVVEFSAFATGVARRVAQFATAGDPGNYRAEVQINSGGTINPVVVDGGVSQASLNLGAYTTNTTAKVALAIAANNFAGSVNGGTPATDSSGTVPAVNKLSLGSYDTSSDFLGGYIRRLAVYSGALPVQRLSA